MHPVVRIGLSTSDFKVKKKRRVTVVYTQDNAWDDQPADARQGYVSGLIHHLLVTGECTPAAGAGFWEARPARRRSCLGGLVAGPQQSSEQSPYSAASPLQLFPYGVWG